MELKIDIPRVLDAWHDDVGQSLGEKVKGCVNAYNREADSFSLVTEDVETALSRLIHYASKEHEINSLTVF